VNELGNSSVDLVVRIWAPSKVWYDVRMELLWKIKTAIEAEGIEIPFPQRTVWFAQAESKEAAVSASGQSGVITPGGAPGMPNHDE
jgi:small-conductance mechanosensitive channel